MKLDCVYNYNYNYIYKIIYIFIYIYGSVKYTYMNLRLDCLNGLQDIKLFF